MKASTKEEALYLFLKGEDKGDYDSFEEAVENEVENNYSEYYECDGEEWLVFEDEDEAEEWAKQGLIDLFDDIGVFGLSDFTTSWIVDHALDDSWFEKFQEESNESYAYDIKDEDSSDDELYVSRLHEEMVEAGIMEDLESLSIVNKGEDPNVDISEVENDVEDNIDEFVAWLADQQGDAFEYYRSNFGEDDLQEVAKRYNLVDEDAVAEMIIDVDGLGQTISGYDGEQHEQDSYLLFRHN